MTRPTMQRGRKAAAEAFGADLTARQRMIFDHLVDFLAAHGYPPTVREIAEYFGMRSTNGVHEHLLALEKKGYINREGKASRGLTLLKLPDGTTSPDGVAPAGGTEAGGAVSAASTAGAKVLPLRPRHEAAVQTIPVLGKVAAGVPIPAVEQADDVLTLDASLVGGGEVFALRVQGRSMIEAGILPHDLLLVRSTPRVDNGRIAVVDVDGEVTVKRFYAEAGGVRLVAENREMAPMFFTAEAAAQMRVLGEVAGVVRTLH